MPNRNFTKVVDSTIRHLAKTSNFTSLSKGSSIRNLIELVSAEIIAVYRQSEIDRLQSAPGTATAKGLELICDLFNINRLKRTRASAPMADLNVHFYTDTGYANFGALATAPNINVGDVISTNAGSQKVSYMITEAPTLNLSANTYYVGVTALQSGAIHNVGANSLINHSYSIDGLLVRNTFGITNGKNDEDDGQLRYRLFNAVKSLQTSNNRAIFIASRIVPGVGDIKILRNLFGIGTFTIVVLPVSGKNPSKAILSAVKENVTSVLPASTRLFVTGPDIVGLEMNITINYNKSLTLNQKNVIGRSMSRAVKTLINRRKLGENLSLRQIAKVASTVSTDIKSIGNSDNTIGRVWIHRNETAGDYGNRFREEVLFSDYLGPTIAMQNWEVLAVEDSISNPISFTHGTEG